MAQLANFFTFIATPMAYLLNWIYGFSNDYGVSIIIFTLFVRGALFPLYASQIKGQLKMAEIQPKMQAIQKKYADDREALGREMQRLYKEEQYNPMMGCLPLLIQMPILMGLFYMLRNPGLYVDNVSMIMASHESFWWIQDLSQPDPWALPLVTGATTFLSMSVSGMMAGAGGAGDGGMGATMQPMMKMMRIFMPVFLVVIARQMPSGLAIYWMIGNLFTVGQTWMLKRMRKQAQEKRDKEKI